MFARFGSIAIALVAGVSLFGWPAMSQDNIDPSFRQHLDELYPFIEQNAAPPGRWQQYDNRPGQFWSGKLGWRTRHGDAVVMWSLARPSRAWGVRLADGTVIEAEATMGSPLPWRYQLPGALRRWLHGTVEIRPEGVTFAPGEQPKYEPPAVGDSPNLEADLAGHDALRHRLIDEQFAEMLYAYLANGDFWKLGGERIWSIGMSRGGALVANLRGYGDTYIDYYPYGASGPVSEATREMRRRFGQPELSPEEAAVQAQRLAWFNEITELLQAVGWRRATEEDMAVAGGIYALRYRLVGAAAGSPDAGMGERAAGAQDGRRDRDEPRGARSHDRATAART
jgi:hypothetical protein